MPLAYKNGYKLIYRMIVKEAEELNGILGLKTDDFVTCELLRVNLYYGTVNNVCWKGLRSNRYNFFLQLFSKPADAMSHNVVIEGEDSFSLGRQGRNANTFC